MPALSRSLLLCTFALGAPCALAAPDIIVGLTTDRFDPSCITGCSLREAIYQANQDPGPNQVILHDATYQLSLDDPVWNFDEEPDPDEDQGVRGDLDVQGELTLVGESQAGTIIRGTTDRLIEVVPGAAFVLRRLTLRDGQADTYGGAIRNHGTTLAREVSFLYNRANAGIQGQGGAIANFGQLDVAFALFEDNNSNGDEGFYGRGGGIFNRGTLLLRDSTLRGNTATDDDANYGQGGALYNEGQADVARSTFVANAAGIPQFGGGGGAIANRVQGRLKLTNSTISGNQGADLNGVLANGISNFFEEDVDAQLQLINVSLVGNAGLALSNRGHLLIRNSLVAGNRLAGMPANCSNEGDYRMRGLLLGTDQGNCSSDVPVDDALTFSHVLYPLADNGGSTWTHALRRRSPALDAAIDACTQSDQRGVPRPRDGDGDGTAVCDLGAYERSRP